MSLGEVDTLNLTFDKLQALFDESQGYYESFLDANNLYKTGKLSDKEFIQKLGDYVVAYSALEFLSVKVIMEMKKTLDKIAAGAPAGGTQSPGLMPGMGNPGMTTDWNPFLRIDPRSPAAFGSPQNFGSPFKPREVVFGGGEFPARDGGVRVGNSNDRHPAGCFELS